MVKEGDMLGVGTHMVTKIVSDGVLLVSEEGGVDLLSLNYLPERVVSNADLAPPAPAEPIISNEPQPQN